MINSSQQMDLDDMDVQVLRELQADGRISNVELARRVNLSPPATHARIKRLQQQGYIKAAVAILDREKLGFDLLCFIQISLQMHQLEQVERFRQAVRQMPEVLECYHLTGEYDYLLKVVIRNRQDLERFVVGNLTPLPGVARIHTSVVFSEVKSATALPIE